VILHGRHGGCHFDGQSPSQWPCPPGTETRYDLGLAYLAQALTEVGYGVLVPNLNAAFSDTFGATPTTRNTLADQRSQQIIEAHLTRLAAANRGEAVDFGVALTGRIDWTKLALVGHSMGGGAAALWALNRQHNRSVEAVSGGLGPVAALVLVSPTRSHPLARRPEAYHLADVPSVVLMGGCDRDIFDLSSLYYLETADQDPWRTTPAAAILLLGANHNFFNAAVGQDDYYRRPDNAALCNPQRSQQRLSRVAQENFLTQYTQDFLQAALNPHHATAVLTRLGLNPDRAAPSQLYGLPVLTNLALPPTQRYTVFNASTDLVHYQPSPQLVLDRCTAFAPCGEGHRPLPPFPDRLHIRWQTPTESLRFPLDRADLSAFSSLQLRLALDTSPPAPPSSLAVILHDQTGQSVRVDIPPSTPALYRFDPYLSPSTAPTYPTALRIPLAQFYGIDLTALTAVELAFDTAPEGKIALATVEFLGRE
jgi:dienelactone hydrolase